MTDSSEEGISLLILSSLWPLVALNVTGLLFASRPPSFHLAAPKAPTPSGPLLPQDRRCLGPAASGDVIGGKALERTVAMISAVEWKTAIHLKGFMCILCSGNLICVWFKIC